MPVENVYQNIENVLQRIESIKRRFGVSSTTRGYGSSFAEELDRAMQGENLNGETGKTGTLQGGESNVVTDNAGTADAGIGNVRNDEGSGIAVRKDAHVKGAGLYDDIIEAAAEHFNIPSDVIRAVIKQESGYDREAVSHKGAMGLMQLMPQTAAMLGVENPFDARDNIFGGTRYLAQLLELYGGNLNKALAAYNAGSNRVADEIPDIPETVNFVDNVLENFEEYSNF
jgi:hypothetical protein